MSGELEDIKKLLEQAEGSMQCAVDHFRKGCLSENHFQYAMAQERKKAFKGAMRKLSRLIKQSNVESSK